MQPWEIRRDTMLDLFDKAQPYSMKPALQISREGARLLVEALSGRWSYEKDRREKQTVWYFVANAFSLIVDRSRAGPPEIGVHKYKSDYDPFDR